MVSDAYRFVVPLAAIALVALLLGGTAVAAVALVLALSVAFFFRNPRRDIPAGDRLVVSPADGKVVKISELPEGSELAGGHAVSIFLNIFNVHVTRAPIGGLLEKLEYRRGRFKAAFDDEASHVNEQNVLTIRGQGARSL